MKKLKLLSIALLTLTFGLTACDTGGGQGGGGGGGGGSEPSEESVIKSLTAKVSATEVKIGETTSVSAFYDIKGYKTLSTKQKKVTITSSNPDAVRIAGGLMTGLVVDGTSTITVTSQEDPTKSCSFSVSVKDIYFSRKYSTLNGANDMSKELPADGGYIVTDGGSSDDIMLNVAPSKNFIVSTKLAIHSVNNDDFPKYGFVFKQLDEDEELTTNWIHIFLDAPMNRVTEGHANWTDFGYCEVSGNSYAWDVNNYNICRHKEDVFIKSTGIDYNEFFTMTAVVQGRDISLFLGYGEGENAKEVYMFTIQTYADLFGAGEGNGFLPGFFHFKSSVTYKDYSFTTDADAITAKMAGVEKRYAEYDQGSHEGTRYTEE